MAADIFGVDIQQSPAALSATDVYVSVGVGIAPMLVSSLKLSFASNTTIAQNLGGAGGMAIAQGAARGKFEITGGVAGYAEVVAFLAKFSVIELMFTNTMSINQVQSGAKCSKPAAGFTAIGCLASTFNIMATSAGDGMTVFNCGGVFMSLVPVGQGGL